MRFLSPGQRLVLASNNPGKLDEIKTLLATLDLEVILQSELQIPAAEETGASFNENSLIKARNACQHSGLPAIADDSGLEVFALNGEPGVHSAHYAGPQATDQQNNEKLLNSMKIFSGSDRNARFHCVLTVLRQAGDPTPLVCHGRWDGKINTEPEGVNGFGYDPLFYVTGEHCTSAQLPPELKNRISHRARAFEQLIEKLHSD